MGFGFRKRGRSLGRPVICNNLARLSGIFGQKRPPKAVFEIKPIFKINTTYEQD
jgi:hypothetical protein